VSLSPPDLVTILFFGTWNFFLILNRIAMWVFDTRMYRVSHTRYQWGGYCLFIPRIHENMYIIMFIFSYKLKKTLMQIPNWYFEMNIPDQHGYVCGRWIWYVRWDQIHVTMWNEADIFRGLLDFVVSIQLPFNYLFTYYYYYYYYYGTNGEDSLQTQTKKEYGSSQPQTSFYFIKHTHTYHLM
jgi:hypothetical protein